MTRVRDLGVRIGRFQPGPLGAITDVAGVRVGHVTRLDDAGPVRTGVTAVIPAAGDVFGERVFAGCHVLNGAGDVTGLLQVQEWGVCETPILLTNTLAVGRVADAAITWLARQHPRMGVDLDVVIPIVAECDDSFLNDALGRHIVDADVAQALDAAVDGPVVEGSVGAGTGMQTFNFAGGIGTASRVVDSGGGRATLGALCLSNFGDREALRVDGLPVGRLLAPEFDAYSKRGPAGSIVVLLATDAPLLPHQLTRVARRGAFGIVRTGGVAPHNSGEFVLAWSTANRLPRGARTNAPVLMTPDRELNGLFEAAADAVEESILNAMCAATQRTGRDGHVVPVLPLERLRELFG